MNPVQETTWLLKNTIESNSLVELLEPDFQVEQTAPESSNITVYDDFDGRLLSANLVLCRVDKQRFQLINGIDSVAEVRASAKSRFWWDFPDSEIKNRLKSLIGLRALLPGASLAMVRMHLSLRNRDAKIVAKGRLLRFNLHEGTRHYLMLKEMRGYKKSFAKARKLLQPILVQEVPDFGLTTLLDVQNQVAGEKNRIHRVHLTPDMPTEDAVRVMAVAMLDEGLRHVDGVAADIDTVFLHRFRISVRKLRALISLLKQSQSPETVETLAPKLASIAGRTSRLRDLDVFLLEKNSYLAMLPEAHEEGLNVLFNRIGKQRQQEKNRVARYFQSNEFRNEIAACRAALSAAPAFQTPMSQKPVLSTAKSLLIKRYRKIKGMSARLDAQSDDEEVHDIRKEFKKFRYLIEFFSELLPKKRTARLLAELKKIQLTLGQFNDYCVQIDFLNSFSDDSQIEMAKALSGLIAILHHHQLETRHQVEGALQRFFTQEMELQIQLAFGAKASGEPQ